MQITEYLGLIGQAQFMRALREREQFQVFRTGSLGYTGRIPMQNLAGKGHLQYFKL